MSVLDDNFPSMEEFFERYGDDGVQEPRDEYYMLHEEYEETYSTQFSYEFALIKDTKLRDVSETPINYDVSEYYFDPQLGLGIHKEIGLVVVFHRDPRKNYIIRSLLFERYAQAIMCKMTLFRGALQLLRAKDELSLKLVLSCEMGEPGLEHARGKLSPQCMPLQAVPIHFGFGCGCGIIRRKYGELSRHSCTQRDSIRPMAFQKFPQGFGLRPANFEVYCPTDDGYVEARARDGPSVSRASSSSLSAQNLRTTTVPDLQHHPLVKKILQEVDRETVHVQVKGMKEAKFVPKIAQLLVGAMTLFSANINHVNLAGLDVVRLFKGAANNTGGTTTNNFNRRPSTYFRAVQTYLTCVQYSKYMAELVYMVLMYGPKPEASLALTEMLDKYRDGEVVLEVNSRDYHNLTGYSQFITADERTRILDQTFTESSLRDIDQLVHWIMDHCIRKEFDENLAVAGDEQQQPDINGVDIESDAIAAGILDEDGDDNNETPEVYLEAMNTTTTAAESLASLYYPLYGGNNNDEEQEEEQNTSNENAFVVYLGYLGAKYPTKQYCRSLSGICYVAKTCILLDIIKQARSRRVSLRDAEDPSVVDTGLYRILAQVRTHYTYLGLSLARSEGNLFRLNFSTGDIFNSDNVVVGHKNMISKIFGRLYDLAQKTIQDLSNGEELDYSVDNARLSDGMVSFTECVRVPLYSRYKHRLLAIHNHNIDLFRKAHTNLSLILITLLHILCLPARSTEIDRLSVEGTSKEYRGVYFLGPTFGFCYNYNKSANSKDPIIREIGPELSSLFLWYVLVFRRMYVELTRVENTTKLYQFDAMLPDKIRRGVLYWFTYGMNNQREYKFCEVRQILKRCIEFHYTKSVTADLDMYRLVYETIARTLGHSVATSTEHYGTIANYPPSVNAADVLRSRHLGQVWHRLGLRRKFIGFEGEVIEPEGEPGDVDEVASDVSIDPASPVNDEVEEVEPLRDDIGGNPVYEDDEVEEVEPLRDDIGGNPVYADDEVDSISDMLMEIPRIDYNRAVGSDPTPVPLLEPSAVPPSEPPAPSRSVPVSAPDAPPVSVSWNDSSLSPNHPSSPYVHQLPGYRPPFSPPYHHAPASSGFALPPQDAYLGAPLYDAHVSREVLLGARKRHSREKKERKERKMERKRKEKERISKREKREKRERKRAEEKREKESAALASPVTPVRTLKVKDVHLYLSATSGRLFRSESPSGPSGPSSPRAMPSGPPTPNLSARRVHPLIYQSSTQSLAVPGSSHPTRVQKQSKQPKQPPSARSLGSPPSFPETPRRSLLSPQHLRQRITESLQASPLGRFFAPSDSPKSVARKGPKIPKNDPVVDDLDYLDEDYLDED